LYPFTGSDMRITMQGIIASYNESVKSGIIRGRSGNLFSFSKMDWSSEAGRQPRPGMAVLFEDGETSLPPGYAHKIKPENDLPWVAV